MQHACVAAHDLVAHTPYAEADMQCQGFRYWIRRPQGGREAARKDPRTPGAVRIRAVAGGAAPNAADGGAAAQAPLLFLHGVGLGLVRSVLDTASVLPWHGPGALETWPSSTRPWFVEQNLKPSSLLHADALPALPAGAGGRMPGPAHAAAGGGARQP